jgi:hypothetical protein
MKPRRIESRLEIYSVGDPGSEVYVCINPTCREAAVYKVVDQDLALFYCETHITADDLDLAEWLGHDVIA